MTLKPKTFSRLKSAKISVCSFAVALVVACSGSSANEDIAEQTAPAASAQTRAPNIIYILADDLGYGDIGAFGQTKIKTPNLDKLAANGMMFTDHYSGSAVCAPSRSALITGQHTGHTQIRGNSGQLETSPYLEAGTQTLGTVLQEAGYTTGTVGKWGLGTFEDDGAPDKQGMDYFYGFIDQVLAHNYYPEYLWEGREKQVLDNGGITMHPKHVALEGRPIEESYKDFIGKDYAGYLMQDKVEGFIRKNANAPFFLYYATTIPHAAIQIPDAELDQYDFPETGGADPENYYSPHPRPRAARAAMITLLDRQVGEIVSTLEELGIADNTLIVFTSDNGPAGEGRGDVEFFDSNGPFRGGKRDLTEGGIRAPMIAYWPGKIKAGSTSDHVSAMWDMLPTAAELAGATLNQEIDGVSFLPTLLGVGGQQEHDFLYWEFHENAGGGPAQAVRMGKWKGLRQAKGVKAKHRADIPLQLYDLEADPAETNNVAAEHPDIVAKIEAALGDRTPARLDRWNFN